MILHYQLCVCVCVCVCESLFNGPVLSVVCVCQSLFDGHVLSVSVNHCLMVMSYQLSVPITV